MSLLRDVRNRYVTIRTPKLGYSVCNTYRSYATAAKTRRAAPSPSWSCKIAREYQMRHPSTVVMNNRRGSRPVAKVFRATDETLRNRKMIIQWKIISSGIRAYVSRHLTYYVYGSYYTSTQYTLFDYESN